MGDPIKAEQSVKHFAVAVSPALAATPFGQRQVPSVPAVSFAVAVAAAQKSFGHDNSLFLLRSTAVDMGKTFKPTEFLPQNPVEGSHSTSHGHMGVITFASGGSCPGAINCGVLRGGNAECGADLANALDALVERMVNELMASPRDFYSNYRKGESTVAAVLAENAGKMLDGVKNGWNKVSDYFSASSYAQIGQDALKASETLASFVPGTPQFNQRAARAAQQAADWVKGTYNEFKDLNREDLKAACKAWLLGLLGELTCSMVDLLAGMAGNPKPVAEQLGEAVAVAEAMAVETAAAAAVDVLVTKGATSASAKIGKVLYKVGGKLDDAGAALYRELKKVQAAKRKPTPPGPRKEGPVLDKPSGQTSTPSKPTTVEPQKPTPSNDSSPGGADGQAKPKCLTCVPGSPHPVNAIYGAKLLEGDQDLDFVIEAPLPLVWQRTYASSNAHEGWLGHGWSVPLAFRLDVTDDAIVFVDMQGRRTVFPSVSVGQQFFSKYEHTTLKRTTRNQYEVLSPDGLRLIFGLGPSDQARLEAREADEAKQAAYEARAWERLLADRAAQGEDPLPAPSADTGE
ncbi:MAG: DUF6531 domain-containing protein, partial [Pseudomonas sp.]|uniref:DUF6531 domain-containing protein n=1 Tax=Pseudomonas sp. TaxID=306 RepID=UPI003393CB7A